MLLTRPVTSRFEVLERDQWERYRESDEAEDDDAVAQLADGKFGGDGSKTQAYRTDIWPRGAAVA